jgi:hypothetical protein
LKDNKEDNMVMCDQSPLHFETRVYNKEKRTIDFKNWQNKSPES